MPERKQTRTADLDYFYGQSGELFSFYRIPKMLFQDSRFQPLSTDAKTLYGILLDRMSLSARNGWLDKAGRVFIIYTVQEVQDLDLPQLRRMAYLLQNCSNNLNQVAKRANESGKIYSADLADLRTRLDELIDIGKQILSKLAEL